MLQRVGLGAMMLAFVGLGVWLASDRVDGWDGLRRAAIHVTISNRLAEPITVISIAVDGVPQQVASKAGSVVAPGGSWRIRLTPIGRSEIDVDLAVRASHSGALHAGVRRVSPAIEDPCHLRVSVSESGLIIAECFNDIEYDNP